MPVPEGDITTTEILEPEVEAAIIAADAEEATEEYEDK